MILHPSEQEALAVIGMELSSSDPPLAAMLGIFTRLTALDGNPAGVAVLPTLRDGQDTGAFVAPLAVRGWKRE